MNEHSASRFADDFVFLEAPRWIDGRLWIADVFDLKLYNFTADGRANLICQLPHRPCGMATLPDGSVIVASMRDRKLMRLVDGEALLYADLSEHATGDANDMVADDEGRLYVGNFGYDLHGGAPLVPAAIHRVDPDGSIHVAASGLEFPNGTVIVDGGRTLVVAETWAARLTAFDRAANGELSNRRLHANLGGRQPDGICADAQGGIWVASYNTGEFVRVLEGGVITDRIDCGPHAVACALGGPDGKTLFCSAYTGSSEDLDARKRLAAIFTVEVDIPAPPGPSRH